MNLVMYSLLTDSAPAKTSTNIDAGGGEMGHGFQVVGLVLLIECLQMFRTAKWTSILVMNSMGARRKSLAFFATNHAFLRLILFRGFLCFCFGWRLTAFKSDKSAIQPPTNKENCNKNDQTDDHILYLAWVIPDNNGHILTEFTR
jgi:hypothetical protein